MRKNRWLTLLASVAVVAVSQSMTAVADTNPQPVDFTHNVWDAPSPVTNAAFDSPTNPAVAGVPICTTTSADANVNTDCNDGTAGPHNETSIAVDPTNPNHIIGGANDYQLTLNADGHVSEKVLSRAHVTFDGGKTWSEYGLFSNSAYQATGDPALAFDASGHAYYATLGFRFVGPRNAQNPDVLVANSADGKTWKDVRVAPGSGVETSVGDLLDKEYIAAWGNGNAIVSFGDFRLGQKGRVVQSTILASVTHDSGATWTAPVVISGLDNAAFVSTPTVAADGRIFVSYLNTRDLATGRDDVRVVEVSPATGALIAGPFTIAADIADGATDYPFDQDGRQTYQDSQFRTWAAGDLTADPKNGAHLAMVWSDMRNSTTPAPADPYKAKTNSDVIVSQSFDHGRTWSAAPVALAIPGDQFMPWGAYDKNGLLRIGYFDRSVDPANHLYGYSVATEKSSGSLTFTTKTITTASSDPTTGDAWFPRTANASFPFATAFIGDYSGIATTPSGGVVAYWTDLRSPVTNFPGRNGLHGEDAYFAATS